MGAREREKECRPQPAGETVRERERMPEREHGRERERMPENQKWRNGITFDLRSPKF